MVNLSGSLPAFTYGPDHQGLTPPAISSGKDLQNKRKKKLYTSLLITVCSRVLNIKVTLSLFLCSFSLRHIIVLQVFATGDCRRDQSLVVRAISKGRQAARKVDHFLMGDTQLPGPGGVILPKVNLTEGTVQQLCKT